MDFNVLVNFTLDSPVLHGLHIFSLLS